VEGTSPWGTTDVIARASTGELLPCRRAGLLAPVLSELLQLDPAKRPDAARAGQMLQELADRRPVRWLDRRPRLRRRAVTAAIASVTALATATGLWVISSGEPVTSDATPALGDPRTADPCGLIDAAALNRFGDTSLDSAYGGFNRCDVLVTLPSGAEADIAVEFEQLPRSGWEKGRGLRVIRHPESDGQCEHLVPLADANGVSVTAKLIPGSPPAELCGMAEAASAHVVAVLKRGTVPRRASRPDGASLATRNACTMLDAGSLVRVLGAGARSAKSGFGDWECRWSSAADGLSVRLVFDRNTLLDANDGRLVKAGDRDAYIAVTGADCYARLVNRSDVNSQGAPVEELVKIDVSGPRPPDQLCGPAQELGAAAAAALPAAH
jgi:hypothetical protein